MKTANWLSTALACLTLTCAAPRRQAPPPCNETCVDDARVEFAACVTARGFVLYGASWCHSCHEQLKLFGSPAWQRVAYVDCSPRFYEIIPECEAKKFVEYPTWILPDGRRLVGIQSLRKIAGLSGCPLPP
jgi:hypothetical protein